MIGLSYEEIHALRIMLDARLRLLRQCHAPYANDTTMQYIGEEERILTSIRQKIDHREPCTVYAVMRLYENDYDPVAVFSQKAAAEAFAQYLSEQEQDTAWFRVDAWPVDLATHQDVARERHWHEVWIRTDGSEAHARPFLTLSEEDAELIALGPFRVEEGHADWLHLCVKARNRDEAIAHAQETLNNLIATDSLTLLPRLCRP